MSTAFVIIVAAIACLLAAKFIPARYIKDPAVRAAALALVLIGFFPALLVWRLFSSIRKMQAELQPGAEFGPLHGRLWFVLVVACGGAAAIAGVAWSWVHKRGPRTPVPSGPSSPPAPPIASPDLPETTILERAYDPMGVYVIALGMFAAALGLLSIAVLLVGLAYVPQARVEALLESAVWRFVLAAVMVGMGNPLLFAVPAIALLVLAIGLVFFRPWARVFTNIVAALLLFTFMNAALAFLVFRRVVVWQLAVAAFCAWTLWYLNRQKVRAAFEKKRPAAPYQINDRNGPDAASATTRA